MSDGRGPIFIGGLAYSGKTPLRIALEAHPNISMTRRSYMWDRYYERFGDLRDERNLERCLATMLRDEGVRRLEPDPERIRREFRSGAPTYAHLFALLHEHHASRLGKPRWGEQLGFVERFADPIFDAFPEARMIHMIRDPRTRYAAGAGRVRHRPGAVGWQTAMWLASADLAERNRRRFPGRYAVVRFETLASQPSSTVREICSFLSEGYPVSVAEVVARLDLGGEPSAGASPDRVPATAAAFVARYAARELPTFDYPTRTAAMSGREHLSYLLLDLPLNRATMAAWQVFGRGGSAERARS